jgi:LCP family protein required for cell wall assembly
VARKKKDWDTVGNNLVEKKEKTVRIKKKDVEKSDKKTKGPVKKNRKARLLVSGMIAILVIALVIMVANIRPGGAGKEILDDWKTPAYLEGKSKNILICGLDNDEGRPEDPWLTDVIMVANFNLQDNQAALLQIPRDTYVGEALVDGGKINALYYYGYKDEDDKPGVKRLAETINTQMKLPIDNYVLITMEGFRVAVDILGGVEVVVDKTIDMGDGIVFEAGVPYVLDGVMADKFVRYRGYAMADIERQNVQRYFMKALMSRLLETSTMDLARLAKAIYPHLETDLSISELLQLATEAKALTLDRVTVVRVPGEGVMDGKWVNNNVFTVHCKELADLLNQYMRPFAEPVPETDLEVIQLQKSTTWLGDGSATLDEYDIDALPPDGTGDQDADAG